MKKYLYILLSVLCVASCSVGEYRGMYDVEPSGDFSGEFMAILTVKKSTQDTVFFQLNDSTTIYPANYQDKYTRMERVFCDIVAWNKPTGSYDYSCSVEWAESIEEGSVVPAGSPSGKDYIDILDDWMTSVEDGYLTVHYNVLWGLTPTAHGFSVVTGTDPEDPYVLHLRHDARGDTMDEKADGLVCFDINSLPSTEGKYKILTLKWYNLGGSASEKKFKFKTRE
ncbi:MAG: NigD-like N-terminal domain-containing protein [Bacteroidales bacterium]|nr:NigD-like N-terminal domain-containing protein [Bacteroidales bacterium]